MKELSMKQKLFCEEYVANGYHQSKAYMAAFPDASSETARANASILLKRDDIKQRIKDIQHERFEALNISADRIACELSTMAFGEITDTNNQAGKLKAIELLAKQLGLYTTKVDADINGKTEITITIGNDQLEDSPN